MKTITAHLVGGPKHGDTINITSGSQHEILVPYFEPGHNWSSYRSYGGYGTHDTTTGAPYRTGFYRFIKMMDLDRSVRHSDRGAAIYEWAGAR